MSVEKKPTKKPTKKPNTPIIPKLPAIFSAVSEGMKYILVGYIAYLLSNVLLAIITSIESTSV